MNKKLERVYLAGGCLWGVQAFVKTLNGVIKTEAGRANGTSNSLFTAYDGYAECVQIDFDPQIVTITQLMEYLFEIIDPYSLNKQGIDIGPKYRTGLYSKEEKHIVEAKDFIAKRSDKDKVAVEVLPLTNYVKSADEHQDRLDRCPDDYCHISKELLEKYKR